MEYLKIGRIDQTDGKVVREWHGQGVIFKDEDAFFELPGSALLYAGTRKRSARSRKLLHEE